MKTQLFAKIYDALIDHADSMSGGYDIVRPGQNYPTAADTAFIVVTDVWLGIDRPYIGSTADDVHIGMFQMDAMVPLSWTHSQLLGIAGLIRDHFDKDTLIDDVVRIEMTPMITASYRDGAFNRLPVSIGWRSVG